MGGVGVIGADTGERGRSHRGRYRRAAVCHCTQGVRGRGHRGRYRRAAVCRCTQGGRAGVIGAGTGEWQSVPVPWVEGAAR